MPNYLKNTKLFKKNFSKELCFSKCTSTSRKLHLRFIILNKLSYKKINFFMLIEFVPKAVHRMS